jgi:hypothetical protein
MKTSQVRRPWRRLAAGLVLLIAVLAGAGCVHDTWIEVPTLHPGDMTLSELEAWQMEVARIDDALEEINDEHEYKRREYECDSFSDYTAGELTGRCFVVKRAMSYTFQYPDGRTGLHHWIFVVVEIGSRELWVPVECTPPPGERQKQYGCDGAEADGGCQGLRVRQFPMVADEAYHSLLAGELKPGQRFDERYFGSIIVWDVAAAECTATSPPDRQYGGGRACLSDRVAILAD